MLTVALWHQDNATFWIFYKSLEQKEDKNNERPEKERENASNQILVPSTEQNKKGSWISYIFSDEQFVKPL